MKLNAWSAPIAKLKWKPKTKWQHARHQPEQRQELTNDLDYYERLMERKVKEAQR